MQRTIDEALAAAIETIRVGDVAALGARLAANPELARARWSGTETPYEGYFHGATLLHHLSGNPLVTPVPARAVELARTLLDHRAEIDALTLAGPSQPDDIGWTTLGLVATSAEARKAGVQQAMIDALLERGADVDAPRGGPLMGALYYGELDAAAQLAARGARVDFVAAAGLGQLERMDGFVSSSGELSPQAHSLVHYSLVRAPAVETRADVLALALAYAAKCGRIECAERLVRLGADVNSRPHFDHRATALHWTVVGEQPDMARWLLARGADRTARDSSFHSSPLEWAHHMERPRMIEVLATETLGST